MAQDLALTGGGLNIRSASELCSKGLWKLLTEFRDDEDNSSSRDGALRIIAINPKLRDECRQILPELQQRHEPAGPEGLMVILIRNAAAFGLAGKKPGEWATLFSTYLEVLEVLSAEALDDAFLRWGRCEMYPKEPGRHAFYPRAPELFHLAQKSRLELGSAIWRAKKALEWVDKLPRPEPTKEERAARRQDLIAQGILKPDGSVNMDVKAVPPRPPNSVISGQTPQQMAERIRAAAAERQATSPPDEEVI